MNRWLLFTMYAAWWMIEELNSPSFEQKRSRISDDIRLLMLSIAFYYSTSVTSRTANP